MKLAVDSSWLTAHSAWRMAHRQNRKKLKVSLDGGYRIQGAGCKIQDTGYWDSGCRITGQNRLTGKRAQPAQPSITCTTPYSACIR